MPPERTRRAQDLMAAALRLDPERRKEFLERETQGDNDLLSETMVMMESRTRLMETQPLTDDDATEVMPGASRIGQMFDAGSLEDKKQIGNYRILRPIGQGGMGMVYAACLVTEDFQKQVALKLVKPSLASSQVLRRFRMERQLLAALDHPNVARLLDAGTTEEGAPYLVMEFVEGVPLDRYCEIKNLTVVQRLRIFLEVCDAVQYAHQNLIIHRDLKPSNILVSSEGVPKLLDFGIAKLIRPEDQPEEEDMKLTATDARPMSPHYASPEQARGDNITTASDIYSLGVVLYELLTGRLPYEFKARSPAAIEKTICETIPAPPSEVDFKGVLPEPAERHRRRLRGDLDMILLMAMRKEPLRRYSSVAQFATDVRAYLDGLPVVAQRDTFGYRMKKFVQRHAAGVAAAVFVLVSMIVATGVSVYFAREATREKKIAELRFQDTRELARFFIRDFDAAIRAGQTAARRELVNKGLSYLKRLANEAADLELQREVISGYLAVGDVQGNPFGPNLGEVEGARLSYAEALRLAEQYLKLNPGRAELRKDISAATMKLADLDVQSGNRKGALERYLSAKAALEGRDLAILLTKTGFAYYALGDYRRALDEYGKGLDLLREYLRENPGHSETKLLVAQASQRVGDILRKIGEPDAAIATLEDALKTFRELLATDPSNTLWNRGQIACTVILGDTLMAAKRPRDAEARYRESLASAESAMKLDRANMQYQRDFLTASGRLAGLLIDVPGKRNEARSLTARSLETLREMASRPDADSHEMYSYAWMLLTTPFTELQNPKAALFFAAKVSEKRGTADPSSLDLLARAYFANGDSRTATRLEQQALSLLPTDFKSTDLRKEFEDNLRRFQHGARQAAKQ